MKTHSAVIANVPLLFNESFFIQFIKARDFKGTHPGASIADFLSTIESIMYLAHDEYCIFLNIPNSYEREFMSANVLEMRARDVDSVFAEYNNFINMNLDNIDSVINEHFPKTAQFALLAEYFKAV